MLRRNARGRLEVNRNVGALFVCACVLLASAADAQAGRTLSPALNWVRLPGAESCLGARALAQSVEDKAGQAVFVEPTRAELFVDGYVTPQDGGGFEVALEVRLPEGDALGYRTLRFSDEDCAAIDDAVSLVIAVTLYPRTGMPEAGIALSDDTRGALDALFGREPTELDPQSLPTPPQSAKTARWAEAPRDRVPETTPQTEPASASPWVVLLDAAAAAGYGQIPQWTVGVSLHVGLRHRESFPIELSARLWQATEQQAPSASVSPITLGPTEVLRSGRARFALITGEFSACPWTLAESIGLRFCTGIEGGQLSVTPSGFVRGSGTVHEPVGGLTAGPRLRTALADPLTLRAGFSLVVPLLTYTFRYEEADGQVVDLYRPPPVSARLVLGLGFDL